MPINLRETGSMLSLLVYIERPSLRTDADVKTRFSSRLTRQQAVQTLLTRVGGILYSVTRVPLRLEKPQVNPLFTM